MVTSLFTIHHSLTMLLRKHTTTLAPLIHSLAYSTLQQLMKVDLLYWLHHADKRSSKLGNEKTLLLKLREIVQDWLGKNPPPPEQEYKLGTKERRQLAVVCVRRVVSPSHLQMVVLQALLSVFADPHSMAVTAKFFPRFTLLREDDLNLIRDHRQLLGVCAELSSFSAMLTKMDIPSCFAYDSSLSEKGPDWNVPVHLRFPRVLQQYILTNLRQIHTESLFIPLQLCQRAMEECDGNEIVRTELEEECGTLVNMIVEGVTERVYLNCKQLAIAQILTEQGTFVSSPSLLSLNVCVKMNSDNHQ